MRFIKILITLVILFSNVILTYPISNANSLGFHNIILEEQKGFLIPSRNNAACDQILNGRIIQESTKLPLTNATVIINDKNGNVLFTDLTNDNGNYHFNLPCNQQYKIIFSKENFVTITTDIKTNAIDNNLQRIDIALKSNKTCERILSGVVVNSKTNTPIANATIEMIKGMIQKTIVNTLSKGNFNITVPCRSYYELRVSAENYSTHIIKKSRVTEKSKTNNFFIKLHPDKTLQKKPLSLENKEIPEIKISPIIESTPIVESTQVIETETIINTPTILETTSDDLIIPDLTPENIKFELDDSKIDISIAIELNKLIAYMKALPETRVIINSHTDSRGPDLYNLNLTKARSQSMVSYVVANGIDAQRIAGEGYGETKPLNDCTNKNKCNNSQYLLNIRTEYIITTNGHKEDN